MCAMSYMSYAQTVLNYPTLSVKSKTDTIFGSPIIDPYRNFENYKTDPNVINFYQKQDDLTEQHFKKNHIAKKYERYLRNIDANENDIFIDIKSDANGGIYVEKKKKGHSRSALYYLKHIDSAEVLLYNPTNSDSSRRDRYKISEFQPSWNGKTVALGIRNNNSYASEVLLIDVQTKKVTSTKITNARPNEYWGFNWIPSTNSFTYTSVRHTEIDNPDNSVNTSLSIYNIDSNTTKEVFGNGYGIKTDERLIPLTKIHSPKDKYLIAYIAGPSRYWDSYFTSFESLAAGKPNWKPLFKIEDKVLMTRAQLIGDTLFYISGKDNELHNVSKLGLSTNKTNILISEIEEKEIQDIEINTNGVFLSATKNGTSAFFYHYQNDSLKHITLPIKASKIYLNKAAGDENAIYLEVKNPLSSEHLLRYNIKENSFTDLDLYNPADIPLFKDITYTIKDVPSHDGTMIPMTIFHKKNVQLNGQNPVFSYSYGAFGTTVGTSFKTQYLSFVALGGIMVYPHIRGGGEKGDKWHKAGMKTNKQNSWKDLIACMDYLVEKKYTSHNNITMHGVSAGAISVAMAINERPDLAAVVITRSGVLNPLRRSDKNGKNSFVEYGDINIENEALGLIAMDPYLNLPEKANLPAILVRQSFKDDRVYLHEALKYVTKAQLSNTANTNVLLDIDYRGTHGSASDFYDYYGRIFAFSIQNTPFNPQF